MRRLTRLTALCVGVLLLAAPAAFACGELGTMTSRCPMAEMADMSGSMGTSICHDSGQMSKDCCGLPSTPEPIKALSFEGAKLLTALEVTDLEVAAPLTPPGPPPHSTPVDAFHLHDLGRYTLFSSLLL
jgi:hypothetical protein